MSAGFGQAKTGIGIPPPPIEPGWVSRYADLVTRRQEL